MIDWLARSCEESEENAESYSVFWATNATVGELLDLFLGSHGLECQ